jgi:hypothetical protein
MEQEKNDQNITYNINVQQTTNKLKKILFCIYNSKILPQLHHQNQHHDLGNRLVGTDFAYT